MNIPPSLPAQRYQCFFRRHEILAMRLVVFVVANPRVAQVPGRPTDDTVLE